MLKTICHPTTGNAYKLGRLRPSERRVRLRFAAYAKTTLTPPPTCDYTTGAMNALSEMYLNDQLGDCVVAGKAHLEGVFSQGKTILTNDQIDALYSADGGYVPGDPSTDNGCDEGTALDNWAKQGVPIGGDKILGHVVLDGSNALQYRTALWLFENLMFGIELPDAWLNPMPSGSGFTWDVAGDPDPDNGHCIVAAKYDQAGVVIDTWGMLGTLTTAAIAKYVVPAAGGELYSVLTEEIINRATERAPNGIDWATLLADFKAMGA